MCGERLGGQRWSLAGGLNRYRLREGVASAYCIVQPRYRFGKPTRCEFEHRRDTACSKSLNAFMIVDKLNFSA